MPQSSYQELDHASRTGRENLRSGGQWVVEPCCDPALLSNESLQTAANSTENDRSACGYDDEESIDGDTVMSIPGESDIEDDDLCDIPPNLSLWLWICHTTTVRYKASRIYLPKRSRFSRTTG